MPNQLPLLTVPSQILEAIIAQARAEAPNECCGVLAGRSRQRVSHRFPLVNCAATPTNRFESSPESMFAAMKSMKRLGIEILAVYHSHPKSPAKPSVTDREWNYSANVANLIVSLSDEPPEVKCWKVADDYLTPIDLVIV